MSDPFPPPVHRSFVQRLRSWFFTGLIVFGPIAVTAYIAWWVIDTIDNWVRPWLPNILSPDGYLPFHVPGLGVLIAIVGLTLLGFLTANFIGRSLVRFGEGDARSHAARPRRPQGPEAGVRNHLQPVRQPIPQGRAGPVSGSRQLVDCLHLVGPGRDHRRRLAGEEADDLRLHALHAQPHHRILFLYPGRPGRSNCRFPPTRRRNSSCRRASSSRKAKRRSPQWRKRRSSQSRRWRRRRPAADRRKRGLRRLR